MKLLLDQNLSFNLCRLLADRFPDSAHVRRLGLEKATDRAVWDFARANEFVLVSFDSDFAELAALLGPPPKVIWLRCGNQPTAIIEALLRNQSEALAAFEVDEAACFEVY